MFKFKVGILFILLICEQYSNAQPDNIFRTTIPIPGIPYMQPDSIPITTTIPDTNQTETKNNKFQYYKTQLIESLTVHHHPQPTKSKKQQSSNNGFSQYQGKIIRNINFKQLEVFGQSVNDTNAMPHQWSERMGNKLHVNTFPYVLKNRLIFNTGDALDAYILAENERLYRVLPFIDDARFMVKEVGEDSVDVMLIIKDVMPIGASIEIFDVLYGKASISNKSIIGLGHEVYYHNKWNGDRVPFYGHKIRYRIPNIKNTFFSTDISYENQWDIEAFRFTLSRSFFSIRTHYAGGISYEKINSVRNIAYVDTTHYDIEVDYNYYDMWLGRALKIGFLSSDKLKTRIILNSRFKRYEYFKRPDDINEAQLYTYHERDIYMIGLSISSYGYQKSNLIYGFGRTEDIPYGFTIGTTLGIEKSEFQERPYTGLQYSLGTRLTRFGYLYQQTKFGFYSDEELEQGFLTTELKYISPLINRSGRYKFRIYNETEYLSGFNRNKDEFLRFTSDDGIRGLYSNDFKGNKLLKNNFEIACFSPHYLFGFRFVYFTFIDVGIINNNNEFLFQNQLYSGMGGGIRIRNENMVFNTVLIRLAYYPVIPTGASPSNTLITATGNKGFNNFTIARPEVLSYQNR